MSYLRRGDRDRPENRGYQWEVRAEEIKDRDNYTCQSCGSQFTDVESHHIIKGRHLPTGNARAWSNLVALCQDCHNDLEGLPPRIQFRRLGQYDGHMSDYRSDVADVIEHIQTGWRRKKEMRDTLGISKDRMNTIMSNLVQMGCAIKNDDSQYRAPIAEVCRAEWEFSKQRIETLEGKLEREQSLRADCEDRIEEMEAEAEEDERDIKNAVARLETAMMELKADTPILRQASSDVKEAKDLIESVQKDDRREGECEDGVAALMEGTA